MNRRRTLKWLCGAALTPLAAWAQQATRIWRVGVLRVRREPIYEEAFEQGLRDLGHDIGRRTILEYRCAEGKPERFPGFVAELVRLKVDVIVAGGSAAIIAAKEATSAIPIVMAIGGDAGSRSRNQ